MATVIRERKMIEGNALLHEQRLKSPIRRFTDKTFTPTNYWHIDSKRTTVDRGYQDIAEVLGENSPIRFQYIEGLPIYGLEQIVLQLQQQDHGLDSSFESEATIMEDTICPLENDFFMVPILHDAYIFRITGIEYNGIASTRSYKISYTLECIDEDSVRQLQKQTRGEFSCVLENIGTDDRCIIEKSDAQLLEKIDAMCDEIITLYTTFFYNDRYNCFLGDFVNGYRLYDPFLSEFIVKHRLFCKKNQIDGLFLNEQFFDPRREVKYQKSMYRFFEVRRLDHLSTFDYVVFKGRTNPQTAFYRWLDDSIMVVDLPKAMDLTDHYSMMSDEFVESIRSKSEVGTIYQKLLQKFILEKDISIYDIDLDLCEELYKLDGANLEVFFYTPIMLYAIKTIVSNHLKKKTVTG